MTRLAAATLALLAVTVPGFAVAADAPAVAPTPSVDSVFTDPAMTFNAPDGWAKIPTPPHDNPAVFENPAVVAGWVKNRGTAQTETILIRIENFSGSAANYAVSADNDLRGQSDGVFIKSSKTLLPNGMPAVWEEVTLGSGFNQLVTYRYLWADGVRGIAVSETSRLGNLDERQAKKDLSAISAVAFPRYRY